MKFGLKLWNLNWITTPNVSEQHNMLVCVVKKFEITNLSIRSRCVCETQMLPLRNKVLVRQKNYFLHSDPALAVDSNQVSQWLELSPCDHRVMSSSLHCGMWPSAWTFVPGYLSIARVEGLYWYLNKLPGNMMSVRYE